MKDGLADTPGIVSWLTENLSAGDVVGLDGKVCSISDVEAWMSDFKKYDIKVDASRDAFEELWSDRPALPMSRAEIMPIEMVGVAAGEKIAHRSIIRTAGVLSKPKTHAWD
jgi:Xaa-Pro aminopeptidase